MPRTNKVPRNFDLHGMKVLVLHAEMEDEDILKYVRYLDECYQLMRSKGLKKAWYGVVELDCKDCGGNYNGHGAAQYIDETDVVRFHMEKPDRYVVQAMAHELGHRYWWKQMSQEQRSRYTLMVNAKTKSVVMMSDWHAPMDPNEEHIYIGAVRDQMDEIMVPIQVYERLRKFPSWGSFMDKLGDKIVAKGFELGRKFPYVNALPSVKDPTVRSLAEKVQELRTELSDHLLELDTRARPPANLLYEIGFKESRAKYLKETKRLVQGLEDMALKYVKAYVKAFNARAEEGRAEIREKYWDADKFRTSPAPVEPVSDYGKTNIDEAFAEAFSYFVIGEDMTRGQIESFKAVLNPGVRTAWLLDRIVAQVRA